MVRKACLFLVVCFAVGLSVGFVVFTFRMALGSELPDWTPIQYLGAILLVGVVYVVGEILWHPIGRVLVEADKVTDPLWKRGLRVLVLILLGMSPIVVYILWELKSTG